MKIRLPTPEESVVVLNEDSDDVLPRLPSGCVAACITDPPFSERTHKGHDSVIGRSPGDKGYDGGYRKTLGYAAWTLKDIANFVPEMCRVCSGWVVVMNDHTNAPYIIRHMEEAGRYVFAPLPFFQPGRGVRLSGDGPSSWTDWIIVSRTAKQHKWGTLPGGYVAEPGWRDRKHMGGKPLMLMRQLIRHYSRPGDIVLDPFGGSGTTAEAAVLEGRLCLIIEREKEFCDTIRSRVALALEEEFLLPASDFQSKTKDDLLDGMSDPEVWK